MGSVSRRHLSSTFDMTIATRKMAHHRSNVVGDALCQHRASLYSICFVCSGKTHGHSLTYGERENYLIVPCPPI